MWHKLEHTRKEWKPHKKDELVASVTTFWLTKMTREKCDHHHPSVPSHTNSNREARRRFWLLNLLTSKTNGFFITRVSMSLYSYINMWDVGRAWEKVQNHELEASDSEFFSTWKRVSYNLSNQLGFMDIYQLDVCFQLPLDVYTCALSLVKTSLSTYRVLLQSALFGIRFQVH